VEDQKNTLGNTDKIYSAYKGDLGKEFQQSTRERFAWQASVIKGEKILDIGCSQGILPILLAREGKKVVGIDISEEAIDFANKLKSEETETTQKNVKFIQGDFLKLNIKEKFDTIILGETLEHFFYPEKLITKILKNLNKNGIVIATVPFGINDYYDHRKTYYLHDLLKLIWADFDVKEIEYSEIRSTHNWVGIVATKSKSSSKKFTSIDSKVLQNLEENIYKNERRLLGNITWLREEISKREALLEERNKELQLYSADKEKLNTEIENLKLKQEKLLEKQNKELQLYSADKEKLNAEIENLKKDNARLNSTVNKYERRKIIRFIDHIKKLLQAPKNFLKKLIKKTKNIVKTFLKFFYSIKAKKVKQKLENLAQQVPDSNGSSLFKKLDVNVAVITDEFMFNYYKDAVNLHYVNYDNYKDVITADTDFVLFISCWQGIKNDDWKGIAGESKRKELFEIFDFARKKGVKIVFQTIEDPSNYEIFLPIAKESDYIFTSDKDKINDYIEDTDNENVFFLEYGINPFLHNPIGCNIKNERNLPTKNKVFFAGSWAKRYKDRCNDLKTIFNGILKSRQPLIIADRNYGNQNYAYPFKYEHLIIPAINHEILQKVHKLFDWNVNVNSIKQSSTMCAMRVYELQALGSLILSNYAISVYNRFPNIFIINDSNEVKHILNGYSEKEKYQMKVKSIRNVYTNCTVFDRLSYIFDKIELNKQIIIEDNLLVVCDKKTKKIIDMFNNQTYPHKTLIEKSELGEIDINKYNYITFFSSTNNYLDYYLEDMMNCFKFVDVPYVTKKGYFNKKGKLIGTTHNYTDSYEDKNKTIFNLKKFSLKDILSESKKNVKGYASDPFELNEETYSIKEIKENKELGVVVPIYNNGEFLYGKAFLSLRRSSIFNKMHILLVDDGSSDLNTLRTIKRIARSYPNISTYFFPKGGSGSPSRPRNKGVEILNTPYITYLDPDNEAIEDSYKKLLQKLRGKSFDFIFGYIVKIDGSKEINIKIFNSNKIINDTRRTLIEGDFFIQSVQACIFKKEFLTKNNIKYIEGAIGEDSLFFQEAFLKAQKIRYLSIPVHIYYAERDDSIVNKISSNFFEKSLILEKHQVKKFKSYGLLEQYKEKKFYYFMKNWYGTKLERVKKEDYEKSLNILKEITSLYNLDIEKDLTQRYLNKILGSNGSSYYKKFDVNIGVITDNLAFDYFNDSANFIYIGPNNYKKALDNKDIDMLMFISCWKGMDNEDLRGISGNQKIRNKVIEIFNYAKNRRIPVVYWSKEDPAHYDIYHEFSKYADYIFTTAVECITDYKTYTGNNNVYTLEFAVNPFIHNPISFRIKNKENFNTLNKVLFAGSWYKNHPERIKDQAMLFDGVLRSNKDLVIIDRNYFIPSGQLTYPEKYQQYTYPPIEYKKLQRFHKLFDWSLDLNSIKDSNTMCAARVFELQGSGSAMISNPTRSVEKKFPNIFIANTSEKVTNILNNTSDEEIYRRQLEGIRNVYTDNTVFERLSDILYKVGLINEPLQPKEIVTICNSKSDKIVEMFNKQTYPNKKLITEEEAKNIKPDGFITFFSEKYNYGTHYLQDMINGFKYTNSAFITKDPKVEHNYVDFTNDKYRTMFNPKKISIEDMLNKNEFKAEGYSIDPFELEKIN
jgi:2-polyprenyl-3-methyl-5-hydroxy-6-metoxy-1,4-benzoquinol methylase/spore maturation protein CgeB